MMVFGVRDVRDRVDEAHRVEEVLELPFARECSCASSASCHSGFSCFISACASARDSGCTPPSQGSHFLLVELAHADSFRA